MKRSLLLASGLAVAVFGVARPASAQPPVGLPGPAVAPTPPYSPYLNLLQRGTNPAISYYGIVRPQMEFRNAIQGLQYQAAITRQSLATQQQYDPQTGLPLTGHASYFMNLGGYFMRTGAGAPGVGGFRAPAPVGGVQAGRAPMAGAAPTAPPAGRAPTRR